MSTVTTNKGLAKNAITRAWNDIEPKVIAWFAAGGLLTLASIVYGYVYPDGVLPTWAAPVITFAGGAIVAYLKRSKATVAVVSDNSADTSQPAQKVATKPDTPEPEKPADPVIAQPAAPEQPVLPVVGPDDTANAKLTATGVATPETPVQDA